MRKVRDQSISDWLEVTAAEAELLERLPPASRFQPKRLAAALDSRPEKVPGADAQNRRIAILEIVREREAA
jgi:hypothetical protein